MNVHYIAIAQIVTMFLQLMLLAAIWFYKIDPNFGLTTSRVLLCINLMFGAAVMGCYWLTK